MKNYLLLVLILFLFSCTESLEKQVNKSVTDLTSAVDAINANAANTINILNGIKKDYPEQIRDIINNDVDRLVKTTIFSIGTEARCESDFVARRIKLGLQNTIIKLKNKLLDDKHQLPLVKFPPAFCNCTPEQIDLNESNEKPLKVYGYDFDDYARIKVLATKGDGTKSDLSKILARPSDYLLTLGTDNASNFEGYSKVEFYYNDMSIYSLLIVPKTPKICEEEDWNFSPTPQTIDFYATPCGGDSEFGGAAYITCVGTLKLSDDQRTIICHIKFNADEVDGDTHGCWEKDYPLYTAKNGYKIKTILTPTTYYVAYKHNDEKVRPLGGDGFVKSVVYRGDQHGEDIGEYTGASLTLSNITVSLIEDGNGCVSKDVYISSHPETRVSSEQVKAQIDKNQSAIIQAIDKLQKK